MSTNGAKQKILNAAENLISKNGITDTTIAEIAGRAKVADSHIYLYFKGKEGLLFALAQMRIKEAYDQIEEQLIGIKDPVSQLSRIIWHSLNYNDNHPGYVRILFDCFTKKEFYETPAYHQGKKLAKVFLDILERGVAEGVFREDVNMRIMQLVILGIIDQESVSRIMINDSDAGSQNLDDVMNVIYAMILKNPVTKKIKKKDQILITAQHIFAREGYNKTNIAEIAEIAQVGKKSIYYYFKDKEDLLFSIIEKKLIGREKFSKKTTVVNNSYQKLRHFLEYHFWLFSGDPDFCNVFISDVQLNKNFFVSKYYTTFEEYFKQLESIIEEGKNDGSFREVLSNRVFKNMFIGAFARITLRWIIFGEKNNFDKLFEASQCIKLFLRAAQKNDA